MSSLPRNPSGDQSAPPRTFPSVRLNTSFTRDESHDIQWLDLVVPSGDLEVDPADRPAWTDKSIWSVTPRLRAVPDDDVNDITYPF